MWGWSCRNNWRVLNSSNLPINIFWCKTNTFMWRTSEDSMLQLWRYVLFLHNLLRRTVGKTCSNRARSWSRAVRLLWLRTAWFCSKNSMQKRSSVFLASCIFQIKWAVSREVVTASSCSGRIVCGHIQVVCKFKFKF